MNFGLLSLHGYPPLQVGIQHCPTGNAGFAEANPLERSGSMIEPTAPCIPPYRRHPEETDFGCGE
jgi:hypothetical protein